MEDIHQSSYRVRFEGASLRELLQGGFRVDLNGPESAVQCAHGLFIWEVGGNAYVMTVILQAFGDSEHRLYIAP